MTNVVLFNWPKYVLGLVVITVTVVIAAFHPAARTTWSTLGLAAITATLLPLLVTHLVYDHSDLYRMPWLDDVRLDPSPRVLNLNAGFDESSVILRKQFPGGDLIVVDLFDATRCTEPSIKRARKAYPPFPGTLGLTNGGLPVPDSSIDLVIAFLSLHELRSHPDRVATLKEVRRTLSRNGRLLVTEHLRDLPNALAFTIGVLHFHSRRKWTEAFEEAGMRVVGVHSTARFITTFVLSPE